MNWGYISAQKLESESSKSFAVSISPQTKPHQQIVYSVRDIKISPKSREIEPKFVKITMRVKQSRELFESAILSFFKVNSGYISAQKLESESSKSFAAPISLQTKAIRS